MKKVDLKKVMVRAWEIKKQDARNIFGLCLKMAWAEAKTNENDMIAQINNAFPELSITLADAKHIAINAGTITIKYFAFKNFIEKSNASYQKGSYDAATKTIELKELVLTRPYRENRTLEEQIEKINNTVLMQALNA